MEVVISMFSLIFKRIAVSLVSIAHIPVSSALQFLSSQQYALCRSYVEMFNHGINIIAFVDGCYHR